MPHFTIILYKSENRNSKILKHRDLNTEATGFCAIASLYRVWIGARVAETGHFPSGTSAKNVFQTVEITAENFFIDQTFLIDQEVIV